MSKNQRLKIDDTVFVCTPVAAKILKKQLATARYKLKLPYSGYIEDIEIAYRDILLDLQKSPSSTITEKMALQAVSALQDSEKKKPLNTLSEYFARYMRPLFNRKRIKAWYGKSKKPLSSAVFIFLFCCSVLAFIKISQANLGSKGPDYSGPLGSTIAAQAANDPLWVQILPLVSLAIIAGLLFFAIFKPKIRLCSAVISIAIFSLTLAVLLVAPHPTTNVLTANTQINGCNASITFLDTLNVPKSSQIYYDLQKNGWRLAATLPQGIESLNGPACSQYFELLAKNPSQNIMLITVRVSETGEVTPYYFVDSQNAINQFRYAWFVKS